MTDEASGGLGVNLSRRKILLGALFGGVASVTLARKPHKHLDYLGSAKLDNLIPKTIGQWEFATTSGLIVPPDDSLRSEIYSQVLMRVYVDKAGAADPPIMLLIAQSPAQVGILQIHRPEFCYPAGGFELSPTVERTIRSNDRTFPVNQLTATAPGRIEQILYWTRVGDAMPASWAQQRMAIAVDNLKGLIPDAVLVRVSTIDADRELAYGRLARFAETVVRDLPNSTRNILVSAS